MSNDDIRQAFAAASRRARLRWPADLDEFIRYFRQELEIELAEAWGRQKGYC
ncbi:hypothetical protein K7W42_13620 [Deinococcus sp. HMF7604]|uniref:hypothetical protein n=1 Tax=Deinococcus betulae TaxID=2873312 RepID=UPI001CCF20C3|nr:hypothetical protein [Deinococcus betulae]MBZ9751894.1 hypothetical protein [Deinococcus betulae]